MLEVRDIYYAYIYGWLNTIFEVTDTVLFRPELELGNAFKENLTIKEYLKKHYKINIEKLNIMMDHGIFVSDELFKRFFGVEKNLPNLIKVYDVLGVNYGLAFDVPSRLQLQTAIEIAVSKFLNIEPNEKMIKSVYPLLKPQIYKLAETFLSYIDPNDKSLKPRVIKNKLMRLMKEKRELYSEVENLSLQTVNETLRNLEEQLRIKKSQGGKFVLIPVIQGLYLEHSKECLRKTIDLLISYEEFLPEKDEKYLYIAIGTGGTVLSTQEAEMINNLLAYGHEYAGKHKVKVRFHILGWSSPTMARKLRLDLVYSSDSLSVRRRAVDGKIYMLEDGKLRLVEVARINPESWKCECPACKSFSSYVLDPSGKRRNDVRFVHSLWSIKKYIGEIINKK